MYLIDVAVVDKINTKFNLWNWVNDNNGAMMCVLTLVYVVATVFILKSNNKSVDAATKANKQSYKLALLDKRLKAYYILNDWISIAKMLYAHNKESTPVELFNAMLFNNPKNIELENINNQIQDIENKMKKEGVAIDQYSELSNERKKLLQNRLMKRIAMLDVEAGLIGQIEILFSTVNYKSIKEFKDDFIHTVIDASDMNVKKLKADLQNLLDENILENMWKEMK